MTPSEAQAILDRNDTAHEMLDMVVSEILDNGVSREEVIMALIHVTATVSHHVALGWFDKHDKIVREGS